MQQRLLAFVPLGRIEIGSVFSDLTPGSHLCLFCVLGVERVLGGLVWFETALQT